MYRGSNQIAVRSQNMLLDALNELLDEKEYKEISIREICDRSGISRQTFYKLFGSKENLLLFRLENSPHAEKHTDEETEIVTLMDTCRHYSQYISANYSQMRMLLENNLMEVFYTQTYTALSTCRQSFVNLSDTEREYAAQFISAGLCRLTQKYIREHEEPDQSELTNLSYIIMSGSIYRQ